MDNIIFMTGNTGFLGTELAAGLAQIDGSRIYVLLRAADEKEAYHRLRAAWSHDKNLYKAIGKRIYPVTGDFTEKDLGLSEEDRRTIEDEATLVIHAGAEIGFQKNKSELIKTNYIGTRNMISMAENIKNLRRFVYISTAYVAGQRKGHVIEDGTVGTVFSNVYEESKAMAESLVRASRLPFSICRPGMIVGNSKSGRVKSFNTVYYVLKLMLLRKLRVLPIKPEAALNIVPVDYVADAVINISFSREAEGKIFHLTCPKEAAPRARELAEYVKAWAEKNLLITLPKPVFLPLTVLKKLGLFYNKKEEGRKNSYLTNLLTLMPYFFSEQDFDRTNTDKICGSFGLDWHNSMDVMLDFACRKNFMHQTGHNIFERAVIRRERHSLPYFLL